MLKTVSVRGHGAHCPLHRHIVQHLQSMKGQNNTCFVVVHFRFLGGDVDTKSVLPYKVTVSVLFYTPLTAISLSDFRS